MTPEGREIRDRKSGIGNQKSEIGPDRCHSRREAVTTFHLSPLTSHSHLSPITSHLALRKDTIRSGEMAERSNAAVLKTVEGQTSGGSNPSLSASFALAARWISNLKGSSRHAGMSLRSKSLSLRQLRFGGAVDIEPEGSSRHAGMSLRSKSLSLRQ